VDRRLSVKRTSIVSVDAWEVLDSRGNPTVACEVTLKDGSRGCASVPSGASTGSHEAHELRDGDEHYEGRGVTRAVANVVGELGIAVRGLDATDQRGIDSTLREADGTPSLSRLGANATLAVSLGSAIAASRSEQSPLWQRFGDEPLLPLPMVNMISGGAHARRAIDIQDVLAVPVGATTFSQALEWMVRVRRNTASIAEDMGVSNGLVADEGGIAGVMTSNRSALELLMRGITASSLLPGSDVSIALDIAANEFRNVQGEYVLSLEGRTLDAGELIDEVQSWLNDFPIVSIEDVVGEDDWESWQLASSTFGSIQVLGDDLFATNRARLDRGIESSVANAVLIKVNQNGTLSGAQDVLNAAQVAGYNTVVSARSGETEDSWLSDLAVGWRSGQIKVGSTTRSERNAKWNRLLRLEHTFGDSAPYAGGQAVVPRGPSAPTKMGECAPTASL
jgi:enolase